MACKRAANYDLIFGILTCNLSEDTIDLDMKVHTLWGIHTCKKDRSTQVIKCSPWGTEVKPFPSLQGKVKEYLRHRQTITTPFANRSYQPRPRATPIRRCNLVTLTRPNREKLSQTRKINVGPYPPVMQMNWLTTVKVKEAEVTAASQAPTPTHPAEIPATQSYTSLSLPDTKYCAVCIPLGKLCPNEYPITTDWDEDPREEVEEGKDQDKVFSVCSDWDADLKEQDRKNWVLEDQKNNGRETPQTNPESTSVNTFISKPSRSSIEQLSNQSSASP